MKFLFSQTLLVLASLVAVFEAQGLLLDAAARSSASQMIPDDVSLAVNSTYQATNATLSKVNATVTGNKVLVTHSNIIIVQDKDKHGLIDYIKKMLMNGTSPQDDNALTTQIIDLLFDVDTTTTSRADIVAKKMPNIKTAIQSRGKPEQLHQVLVELTELSPTETATNDN